MRRFHHWLRAVALVALVTGGCSRGGEPGSSPPEPRPPQVEDEGVGPSLEEIADAIDPGPQPILTAELPPWLEQAVGAGQTGDPAKDLRAAQEQMQSLGGSADLNLSAVVTLARALVLAERATAGSTDSVETLLVLERVYGYLDIPALADERNAFTQTVAMVMSQLAEQDVAQDAEALEQLTTLVIGALRNSGALRRHVVAQLLRKAPEHRAIPDVLARLGPRIFDEDEALAAGVLQRSLSMRGASATAQHWLALSTMCHRVLDVRCGRDALAQAEAVASAEDEDLQEELLEARELAKSAHRAVELREAPGIDDSIERGRALMELQRYDDAHELFEQLSRRHADDARPVIGLARVVLAERFDFMAAAEIVARSQPREHLDRDWYELAIGIRAMALLYGVLPQVMGEQPDRVFDAIRPELTRMRQDIEALEGLGVDEGRVLRFLYDQGMEAWPKIQAEGGAPLMAMVRGLLPRVQALVAEVPRSRHAYGLLMAAAEFSEDRVAALSMIDVDPPVVQEGADALALRRAVGAFDLVAQWDAVDRVPDLLRLVDAAAAHGSLEARRLALDARVLAHRLGAKTADWDELEPRYRALLEEAGADATALLLNNLAVVVAEQGRNEEALTLWLQAAERAADEDEDEDEVPLLNARAFHMSEGKSRGQSAVEDRQVLEQLATDGSAVEVRLQAQAWRVATAADDRQRREATKALERLAATEAAKNYRPRNLPTRSGVILRGSVEAGLGYAVEGGMLLNVDIKGVPWLLLPCPVVVPDPRR